MFRTCSALTNIDLSGFDTSNVTNMNYMFQSCNVLETVDLSNFDTSKVTNMRSMFYMCRNLKKLDISNFDTSKATDFSYFFGSCSNLTTVNGILDLTSCKYFSNVFVNCNIKGLHLKNVPRSLDFSNCGGTEGETYIIDNYID